MNEHEDALKTRKIRFSRKQAEDALDVLKGINSIENLSLLSPKHISITYDIRKLSLQMIEDALEEIGFILDKGLLQRIKRAICAYCEDAERERLGVNLKDSDHQKPLQLNENQAQDPRPNDWRRYT